jgi:hypothetical protein
MLERVRSSMSGSWLSGIVFTLGLAVALPTAACKKKDDDAATDQDESSAKKKPKKGDEKQAKTDDDDAPKKKKASDDDDDDAPKKKGKKVAAPKDVDDDGDDDDDDEDTPKKKAKKLKPASGDVEIAGTYTVVGKRQDGKKYVGTAKISKIGGQMYNASWKIGDEEEHQGLAFKDGNVVSCGWSTNHDLGVMAYLVKPGLLDGVFFEEGQKSIGKEILKGPATTETLSGLYTITKGETPAKKPYGGNLEISVFKSGVYGLSWSRGKITKRGLALRSKKFPGSNTDVLSAGFNDKGVAGVYQYIIMEGGVLLGHWAYGDAESEPRWGIETLTAKD